MEGEDAMFAAPPTEQPENDGGFTMLGDAPPADDAFAAAPPADDAFAAPPADDAFAAPPPAAEEETPIILAPPPAEEQQPPVVDDFESVPAPAPIEAGPMQKFNEEWQVTLAARQQEEETKKAEMVEAARLSLENFQKDREAKREAKMAKNREDEQAKLEAIEADLENDNSWQKVSKMVELTHDGADDAEDVKRMRDVLILLKNEPSRAEAVGA